MPQGTPIAIYPSIIGAAALRALDMFSGMDTVCDYSAKANMLLIIHNVPYLKIYD